MKQETTLGFRSMIRKSRRLLAAGTLLLLVMFCYEAYDHLEEAEENALIAARTLIEKDITYRKWNAQHGGVYVPVTEKTPSNPYLTNVAEKDIETPSGKKLTLMNPAYMTRQVHEIENAASSFRSHITSLKLLRPENKADDWETAALKAFEGGKTEVSSVELIEGKRYLRAMRPLNTDKACLKCHAFQGYKEGDIRGAISASIPMQPFNVGMYKSMATEGAVYLTCWFVGMWLILSRARQEEKNTLALRQSEERHRVMYNRTPAMLHSIDSTGRLISVSDYWLSVMGYERDEVIGRRSAEFLTEASRQHATEVILPEFMKNGSCRDVEYQFVKKDGEIMDVLLSATSERNSDGQIIRSLAVLQDVTLRKQAEKNLMDSEKMFRIMSGQFTALLNAIPDSITLISSDYKILWTNRVAGARIGLEPTAMEGDHCYSIWFNRDTACEECPVRESFQSGEPAEKTILKKDRNIEVRTVPVMGPDGVLNVIRVGRDVTEQVKLEDQVRQSQKMESVGTLAGGIAHDFNNILSAIIGYGQLAVMKMEPDNPYRKNVEHMLAAADKAAYLTQGLLSFSRKQMSNRYQVELNELLQKAETFLRRVIGEDIEFRTNLNKNSLLVLADPNQIEQVLMNLVTNARDAMPKGGVLTITTEQIQLDEEFLGRHGYGKPGNYGLITVSDGGMGMTEDVQQRIFEPFFTTKEVGKGTGLGLAIIYGIVKQHDGFIDVYSEPGEGTTFRIYLPLIESVVLETSKASEPEKPARGTETILLAEDDEILRKLAKSVLQEFGYEVIVAVDGEDAIGKFMENRDRIDLLLTDLIMPKKNGKEVYDEVQKIKPGTKTIFASGYSPDAVRDKVSLGINVPIVYKPISPMDLLKKVRSVLDEGKGKA